MSNQPVLDLLEIAEQQGYHCVRRDNKWMVYAPAGRGIPGYQVVAIHLPRAGDTHQLDSIRANLRRAGVKFDQEQPKSMNRNNPPPVTVAAPAADPFTEASHKINTAIAALSELEGILTKIRAEGAKVAQLRELLKGF